MNKEQQEAYDKLLHVMKTGTWSEIQKARYEFDRLQMEILLKGN